MAAQYEPGKASMRRSNPFQCTSRLPGDDGEDVIRAGLVVGASSSDGETPMWTMALALARCVSRIPSGLMGERQDHVGSTPRHGDERIDGAERDLHRPADRLVATSAPGDQLAHTRRKDVRAASHGPPDEGRAGPADSCGHPVVDERTWCVMSSDVPATVGERWPRCPTAKGSSRSEARSNRCASSIRAGVPAGRSSGT